MITRMLERREFASLPSECGIDALLKYVPEGDAEVIVVEDEGRIVACWSVLRVTHLEGLWIAPEFRGNAGVVRRLLRKTWETARRFSEWAMTGASDDCVRGLIERVGGSKLEMQPYVLRLGA